MFRRMTRERYLSDAELESFMAAVRSRRHVNRPRDHALFALLANTGMRPSEVRALTRGDLHLDRRHPRVMLHRARKKYGPAPLAHLVLNRAVADVVARFVTTLPGDHGVRLFPFTKRQSARLFHYYAGKAGIRPGRKVFSLRHTVGMRLWRHTHDLRLMQAVMGHTNQAATAGYAHTPPEAIREAYLAAGVAG